MITRRRVVETILAVALITVAAFSLIDLLRPDLLKFENNQQGEHDENHLAPFYVDVHGNIAPEDPAQFWEKRLQKQGIDVSGGTRPEYHDVSKQSGLDFVHSSPGARATLNPQMKGPGVLAFDANGDPWADLYFPDYSHRALLGEGKTGNARFFLGEPDFHFRPAPNNGGFPHDFMGMGGAAADMDGDGDQDVLLTGMNFLSLYENMGDGQFQDITEGSGLHADSWPTSAVFLDYDNDGLLDLFILGYVHWDIHRHNEIVQQEQNFRFSDTIPVIHIEDNPHVPKIPEEEMELPGGVYPGHFPKGQSYLFRGLGDGTFEDVSESSGILSKKTKGLGIALLDLEGDGFTDILVANDTVPTHLWHNQGDGTFKEIGEFAGIGRDAQGNTRAGMGVDASYLFEPDQICLTIGFYENEAVPLYCQLPSDDGYRFNRFSDVAPRRGLPNGTFFLVTFGLAFLDFDLDGWEDLFLANGHGSMYSSVVLNPIPFQPTSVYQNMHGKRLDEWILGTSADLGRPLLGRGLVRHDFDRDGDVDILIGQGGGPPVLLSNETNAGNAWLALKLKGIRSNTHGIGAHVYVTCDQHVQHRLLTPCTSFMSQSPMELHFGLGACNENPAVKVQWPSGTIWEGTLAPNRYHELTEQSG